MPGWKEFGFPTQGAGSCTGYGAGRGVDISWEGRKGSGGQTSEGLGDLHTH